jgi:regulator of protease activity HflC (stomatin/prohibitin superfamily)
MAVIYQIGLSDEAARDAAYRVTDSDELIQALSGQILVRYLAQNTLLDLLGKSRETFAAEFQAALQKQLDQFSGGIDIMAISIEAIHPPPAAASAYHNVQAAEVRSQTEVSTSRSDASRSMSLAQTDATQTKNEATTSAAELVGRAQTSAILFDGDRQASARDGTPFLLERWFSNLVTAIPKAQVVIVDHRLHGQDAPFIDLRPGSDSPDSPTFPQMNSPTPGDTKMPVIPDEL